MNKPLFRNEAVQSVQQNMSSQVLDSRINRFKGLLTVLVIVLPLLIFGLFIEISLGVTAAGVLRPEFQSAPIVAQRTGIITDILPDRSPVEVKSNEVIAKISNLDLVTQRNRPNSEFLKQQLLKKREELTRRIKTLKKNSARRRIETNRSEKLRLQLVDQIQSLIPLYESGIDSYRAELERKLPLFQKGLITNDEIEAKQQLLTDRELQFRESMVRLAELERQGSQSRIDQLEFDESVDRELLGLRNNQTEINLELQTEAEIEIVEIQAQSDATLFPKGYISGKTVQAGEVLFEVIAKDSDYLIEVDIPASQIGDLDESLPVKASISAYPYFKHGFFDAEIKTVSQVPNNSIELQDDVSTDAKFRLIIAPLTQSFSEYRHNKSIVPGMDVSVHIRKEKVAFWRILLAPMLRYQSRVFE